MNILVTNNDVSGDPFDNDKHLIREGWTDADMAGNVDDRKSTSGILLYLNGGLICSSSSKQRIVAMSTMEAKYIALSSLTKDILWFQHYLPSGKKAIGCKWVLKIKQNSNRTIERFKARLVIQGFSQTLGEDFFDVFSPVCKMESVRAMIALAAQYDMEMHQLDVANAFLNGVLEDEEVYMQLPQGIFDLQHEGKPLAEKINGYTQMKKDEEQCLRNGRPAPIYALKLHRALYGLKQSPRIWSDLLSNFLQEKGFVRLKTDTCVFIRGKGTSKVIIAVRVDDILVITKDKQELQRLKDEMKTKFKMSDMGEVEWYCAMKITRDRKIGTITLSQEPYIEAMLEKYKLTDIKPANTPFRHNVTLSKAQCPGTEEEKRKMQDKPFRQMVGSLMYVLNTRPDVSFAVITLSRFVNNPGTEHYNTTKNS